MNGALEATASRTAWVTTRLAVATASTTEAFLASSAVITAAKVQPAPETRSSPILRSENTWYSEPSKSTSTASSPGKSMPPLTTTYWGPCSWIRRAASLRSSMVSSFSTPDRVVASKLLGVMTVACGRTLSRRAVSVSRAAPGSWPLQIRTGSRTTCRKELASRAPATVSMVAGVPSMPILTTSRSWAAVAASIWLEMICGSTGTKR
ncbi:conserved hypothetical protein [Corynebacterium efficiens YS-314]|uniref:Uncharacterized protein n=1 Tax=Corynebacterium efficiens (strain DSM 44549 / YS-314 / AJ 12310 / JCM 11189 / NBRC 100395) TaxID=196164 RepID=Q8FSX7_COREF|nr:conserved hypothetical protein [Corynebacterium efficiens YS-314]